MGRQYLQRAQRLGQPGAPVPDLGRLVGRPGRLPRGRRADRRPDARGGQGGPAPGVAGRDAPPPQRRDPPGPPDPGRPARRRSRSTAGPSPTARTPPRPSSSGWPRSRSMLGRPADALKRVDWLVSKGQGRPRGREPGRADPPGAEAGRRRPQAARRGPGEVPRERRAGRARRLDPASRPSSPSEAERVLADFLARVPDNVPAVQLRAQILAEDARPAGRGPQAPALGRRRPGRRTRPRWSSSPCSSWRPRTTRPSPPRSPRSAPRWKDAATGDLLDAQLALARGDLTAASGLLRRGPARRTRTTRSSSSGRPSSTAGPTPRRRPRSSRPSPASDSVKELDAGLSLTTAVAVGPGRHRAGERRPRLGDRPLPRDAQGRDLGRPIARAIRWQLVAAQVAKKEWPAAKAEIDGPAERPQGRPRPPRSGSGPRPTTGSTRRTRRRWPWPTRSSRPTRPTPGAVVTRAEILARAGKHRRGDRDRSAGPSTPRPPAGKKAPAVLYLMMAAVESTDPAGRPGVRAGPWSSLDEGLSRSPDVGRAGPGQVPGPDPHPGAQGRGLGLRRGAGQGRPQGAVSAGCS